VDRRTIDIAGAERAYWTAKPARVDAPLLLVFHGSGIDGPRMAAWTGLADRGPEAGFTTVFPDAAGTVSARGALPHRMWDDTGSGRRDGLDDAGFIKSLIDRLVAERQARSSPVFLVGLSNGASFAERLARHGLVSAAGIALIAGTARAASRGAQPHPARATALLCMAGTADRVAPYEGGRARGLMGYLARRRSRQILLDRGGREAIAVETLAADWAATNGCDPHPYAEPVVGAAGEPGGVRLTWGAPGRPQVIVYRLDGAGHGWPGGPQYAPAFLVGRIPRQPDATGVVLDFARGIAGLA